ncbi:aldo/keto reductase [Candidatus Avelusimicrobium caledoniensis]|uniref:aldo/keto reductase n=1 Tax=Candidatus Avelusimicrobium caledoniensis TaxID=3416220 RepID=UPI003D10C952
MVNFSDDKISCLGLGTWPFGGGYDWGELDEPAAQKAVLSALEQGINFIDTAPVYGNGQSETFLGRVLQGRREKVFLAGKCGLVKNGSWTDHDLHPQAIYKQLAESLTRLKTDYLDLYQIHYPDPKVLLTDAVATLTRLQEKGLIRYIGLCNVSAAQIRACTQAAKIFSVQNEFSLLHPQKGLDVLDACRACGARFIGYGVLCGGILSGKYKTAPNLRRADARNYFYKCYRGTAFDDAQKIVSRVRETARQKNTTPAAVAVAWALQQPGVSHVLFGARNEEQVRQNTAALHVKLTPQEMLFLEGKDAN